MRFDFLFAVTEIVIGDDGKDNPRPVPASDFERAAVVVGLFVIFPAHPVAALPLGSFLPAGEAQILLSNPDQVRSQNDATCWFQKHNNSPVDDGI
jgi:hypothetical protein